MDEIKHSTLSNLRFYDDAYKIKRRMADELSYFSGIYTYEAVAIAVGNAFRGKGSKAIDYRKKPILEEIEEQNNPLSEAELKRQRELFMAQLNVMKSNFEMEKRRQGE